MDKNLEIAKEYFGWFVGFCMVIASFVVTIIAIKKGK